MQRSEVDMKRSQLRNSIRRRQIQQIFSNGRIKLAQQQIKQELEQIMQEIDTDEKKKYWIYKKSEEMGEEPQKSWFQIMRTLSISIKGYKENFLDWIDAGMIRKLTILFRQQYRELNLAELAACIMQDIFYYLDPNAPEIKIILQYEFILDLIELCVPMDTPATSYLELINVIIYDRYQLRDLFIDNGLVQVLVTKLKTFKDYDTDQVYTALNVCYRLVKIYGTRTNYKPKGNVISILIPILDTYLCLVKREDNLRMILKIFSSMAMNSKEHILSSLFACNNLVNCLLHLLTAGDAFSRDASATIIASILFSDKNIYAQELIRRGIFDSVLTCSQMDNNSVHCIESLLQILTNISAASNQVAKKMLEHDVFGLFAIKCAKQTGNAKIFESALFLLTSIISSQEYTLVQILLRQYNLLEILVQGLNTPVPIASVVVQILNALVVLISIYSKIYTGNQNKIIYELERFYNIDNIIAALEEKNGHARVQNFISIFISAMHGEYINNSDLN